MGLLSFLRLDPDHAFARVLLEQREHAGVEEAHLEQHQERNGPVDPVGERVEQRGGEIQTKRELDQRLNGNRLPIFLANPIVATTLDEMRSVIIYGSSGAVSDQEL